jgi:hypothetical protein
MTTLIRRCRAGALAASLAVALFAATPVVSAAPAPPDLADGVEAHERDVFEIVGSTLRNPTVETDPAAPLFTVSGVRLERTPGVALTWGDWTAATATSSVVMKGAKGAHTDVQMTMSGLIPGGLYSVFWGTLGPDSEQPLCPGVERTLPLDAAGSTAKAPAPNAFYADGSGAAAFHGRTDNALLDASQVFFTVVYHFIGRTAYPLPNLGELQSCHSSFGDDAMRHLLILQKWS